MRKRYFTVGEANALLPRIRLRILRMMQLRACLRTDDEGNPVATPPGTPWLADPVLAAWNAEDFDRDEAVAAAIEAVLRAEQAALSGVGVNLTDLGRGLVDFPSLLDGTTEVSLCWHVGEPRVRFFHGAQSGFRDRRPIEGHAFSAEQKPTGQLSG